MFVGHLDIIFREMSMKSFAPFKIRLFDVFVVELFEFFIYSEYYPLTRSLEKYLLPLYHFVTIHFILLHRIFFSLMQSNLSLFIFVACAFDVISKKSFPMSWKFFPMFCSNNFIVLDLMCKYSLYFELIFCTWSKGRVQLHSFVCGYPVFTPPFVDETVLSPLNGLGTLVEDHLTEYARVHFLTLNSTPLRYSCLENPVDGGAWKTAVHGIAEGRTRLSNFTLTFHFHALEKEMATHSSSCLENPRDGGAWWAAVYGITQSRTRLKWLSSSSSLCLSLCWYHTVLITAAL